MGVWVGDSAASAADSGLREISRRWSVGADSLSTVTQALVSLGIAI